MKIIVAHPVAATALKSDLDAVVDVPADEAAIYLADGHARLPEGKKSRSTAAPSGADNEGA